MIRSLNRLALSFVSVLMTAPGAGAADGIGEAGWEVAAVGAARIAVPKGWRSLDNIRPNMPVYRQGDGIGVPATDETGAPLQIGLTVEKLPHLTESAEQIMRGLVKGAGQAPRLDLVGAPSVTPMKLSDGAEAMLMKAEFIKEGSRRSLQIKLVAKDAGNIAWIVSGQLVGGKDSQWPTAGSGWARWLEAHVTSFCRDETKFDAGRVAAAYKERAPR